MEHIKLALQGYNFGNGYIPWAKTKYGGYSYANAVEFSCLLYTSLLRKKSLLLSQAKIRVTQLSRGVPS